MRHPSPSSLAALFTVALSTAVWSSSWSPAQAQAQAQGRWPPVPEITLAEDLAWMDRALTLVEQRLDAGRSSWTRSSNAISSRLTCIELFHDKSDELDQAREAWARRAAALLEHPELNDGRPFGAWLAALLHELTGNRSRGRELLDTTDGRRVRRQPGLSVRRSEQAERDADPDAALALLEATRPQPGTQLNPSALRDLRHGRLLLGVGRMREGVALLQRVADLFPATRNGRLAQAELRAIGLWKQPTLERLLRYVPAGDPENWGHWWHAGLLGEAIGLHAFPESYEYLAERLAIDGMQSPALRGLGSLPDERAAGHLRDTLGSRDLEAARRALLALDRAGCCTPEDGLTFVNGLERVQPPRPGRLPGMPWTRLDAALRQVLGDGPLVTLPPWAPVNELAEPWRQWLGDP